MCGICFVLNYTHCNLDKSHVLLDTQELSSRLKKRGPDHYEELEIANQNSLKLNFFSSVLHLRGSLLEKQPVQDEQGNILLWNGEIFDGSLFNSSESDTKSLSAKLFGCKKMQDVLDMMGLIHGPYAFIFYQKNDELLWFGRDVFGRRSLVLNINNFSFNLSSVAYGEGKWEEVPASGLFCLDLNQNFTKTPFSVYHFPWTTSASGSSKVNFKNNLFDSCYLNLQVKLEFSLNNPILKPLNKSIPSDEIILECSNSFDTCNSEFMNMSYLFKNSIYETVIEHFENVLSKSVRKRVQYQLQLCKKCYNFRKSSTSVAVCSHAPVGILFSGGLDSIVIAALAHKHIPENSPVDLLNVAFASDAKLKDNSLNQASAFDTPDRVTGRNGWEALCKLFPSRVWNFVEIDIPEEELVFQRNNKIRYLLNPSCTVLDDSIGCAIWFASRGKGHIFTQGSYSDYESTARVLLVGMGADEQLGGYSRHRAKYNNFGWSGLLEELVLELDRIGSRNLGRDDRIIADHGVESRYPFLDEEVVSFLNELPIWQKMNLNLPRGIGEKLLLRLLALKLGLKEASILPKRAIQFGSRIARIENTKEKGSDVCERLKNL